MLANIKKAIVIVMITFSVSAALPVVATTYAANGDCDGQTSIFPRWFDHLCGPDKKTIVSPNMGSNGKTADDTAKNFSTWLTIIALNIVQILLTAVGYVSLGFIIYGGFKYMINGDSSSGTVAARKTIQNAIIGLVISIASVAIIQFVTSGIASSSSSSSSTTSSGGSS